ncbi:MAG: cell division protein ZapB [Treponema sp.]|nr:cell division protein ZapB [Treponema sp.]
MVSLEQVQLLESRVAKAIEIVEKTTRENAALVSEREGLQLKLDASQKRLDELELLVMRFKEDQGRIEDGIIAALDRLSQFEEAFESGLKDEKAAGKKNPKKEKTEQALSVEPKAAPSGTSERSSQEDSLDSQEFFEISEDDAEQNSEENELDIF